MRFSGPPRSADAAPGIGTERHRAYDPYSDGGQNWLLQNSGLVFDVFSINFPDKNHGWALCIDDYSNSIILNTTDGGNNWFNTTYNGNDILSSIVFLDSLNGWARLGHCLFVRSRMAYQGD